MSNKFIYGYTSFIDGKLSLNGSIMVNSESDSSDTNLNNCYQKLGIAYPKFFKMDAVSKAGFICSEILLSHIPFIKELKKEHIAVLINSASGSHDTDVKFQETINSKDSYFPSPGLFVYTLPNIIMGEICIRNGFKGENLCLISEKPDINQIFINVSAWLKSGSADICLCGWVEARDNKTSVSLLIVGKDPDKSVAEFTKENLKIYFSSC